MSFNLFMINLNLSIKEYPLTLTNDSSIDLTSIERSISDIIFVDINLTLTTLIVKALIINTSDAYTSITTTI